MKYYPVFLNLKGKRAVVVGGGKVAERKALALIKAGASVEVISPAITSTLKNYTEKGRVKHIKRNYRKGDLKNAFVVIAATSSPETNRQIARDAQAAGNLVNVVDSPSEGNFIVPSVVRQGSLNIAISTEGCSPAVSKLIRKELERNYNSEFARYLRFVNLMRKKLIKEIKNSQKRKELLQALATDEVFNTIRNKGVEAAIRDIKKLLHN